MSIPSASKRSLTASTNCARTVPYPFSARSIQIRPENTTAEFRHGRARRARRAPRRCALPRRLSRRGPARCRPRSRYRNRRPPDARRSHHGGVREFAVRHGDDLVVERAESGHPELEVPDDASVAVPLDPVAAENGSSRVMNTPATKFAIRFWAANPTASESAPARVRTREHDSEPGDRRGERHRDDDGRDRADGCRNVPPAVDR